MYHWQFPNLSAWVSVVFVAAIFQLCSYTTSEYLVRILFHVDELRKCYNFTKKYSGNTRTCTNSQYQIISLLTQGLGTRLVHARCFRDDHTYVLDPDRREVVSLASSFPSSSSSFLKLSLSKLSSLTHFIILSFIPGLLWTNTSHKQ